MALKALHTAILENMQLDKIHANVENILHMHSEKEVVAEQPNTEKCCKNYINTGMLQVVQNLHVFAAHFCI